jgi:polyvinyl alcohol dehydrogenase (cytochrome)
MLASVAVLALAAAAAAVAQAAPGSDWPTYMHDNAHSGYNPSETAITAASVATLAPRWTVRAPAEISSQAVVANGRIFWGSWDGNEHATDPATGAEIWHTYLGDETKPDCSPPHLGVASTATIATVKINGKQRLVDFVGGGNGSFYALDAGTGAILWSRSFGSPSNGYFVWSSPAIFNNSIFLGIASIGDCPLVPGKLVKMNASTGAVQQTFDTVPTGCVGGGIWSTPTIDEPAGMVYVTTGTNGSCAGGEPYAQAALQLQAKNLSLVATWRPPASEQITDGDFGATPTLFTATVKGTARQLVGFANKNGIYYALDRRNFASGPVWESQPISSDPDTIASSAWDGTRLYVGGHGAVINGQTCDGNVRAIDPSSGAFLWSDCFTTGNVEGALTAVPGVVFAGVGSALEAMDSTTGNVLFTYQDTSFHWFYAPPTVANGVVYIGNSGQNFYAFTPGGR